MARSQQTIRLLDTSETPKGKKAAKSSEKPKTVKLAVRLLEGLNGPLRGMTQYRGDLSDMVMAALEEVDLEKAALVDIGAPKAKETCVMLPPPAIRRLKRSAKQREASLNVLVNTAIAHWLADKKAVKLKL